MKRNSLFFIIAASILFFLAACSQPEETGGLSSPESSTPISTGTASPEAKATNRPIVVATASSTPTVAETVTKAATAVSTHTPTPAPTASQTAIPQEIAINDYEMILIPAGFFFMGMNSQTLQEECELFNAGCDEGWFSSSQPVHIVQLDAFYLDRYEVTNEQFVQFLNEMGSHEQTCLAEDCWRASDSKILADDEGFYEIGPSEVNLPVTGVTWYGAAAFCAWRDARLPTEAEWEKAASWQIDNEEKFVYPWGNVFEGNALNHCDDNCDAPQANPSYDDNAAEETEVGSYLNGRSPSGIFDMGGNVWEWTNDWFDENYYAGSPVKNPQGPASGTTHTVRGGSWFDTGNFSATAVRFPAPPTETSNSIGFRCAQGLRPKQN